MQNEKYYKQNKKYSGFLDRQNDVMFGKVLRYILKYSEKDSKILDAGCGTGNLLQLINERENKYGIEISDTSVEICELKNLKVQLYDGKNFPFEENFFDLIVSVNVIEHVDEPMNYLAELNRTLKENGVLLITCPNFLSITNNFHWHVTGYKRKILNLIDLFKKIVRNDISISKMETISRDNFQPDDDACNIMNSIDLYRWGKKNNFDVLYWSGQQLDRNSQLINSIDNTPLKVLFGACFFVFRKHV